MKANRAMASKQLQFIRSLIISQPPTVALPNQSSNTSKIENIQGNDLPNKRTLNDPEFQSLGQPASVLAINSPPSVPIYIRKNSLLSIYGINNSFMNSIKGLVEFINPIKKFIYGGYVSKYQKIISTVPFSLLVSSSSKNLWRTNKQKSFATLLLDGTNDWAVLNNTALQAYTGGTLNVSMFRIPRNISKSLANSLKITNATETGLFRWNNLGYALLTGRGQVGLVGNGAIYNINLKENEEVLINRKNLLSISVNGPYDLQNCIIKYSFPISKPVIDTAISQKEVPLQLNKDEITPSSKFNYYWDIFKGYSSHLINLFRRSKNSTYNFLVGNEDFVRVIGPRNILLQSNSASLHSRSSYEFSTPSILNIKANIEQKSSDFLNYVTIEPGKGAVFKSTPNFKESVQKIEKKSL
ncbi:Altered inheritance of mitochondria protein 24, mitochondrial [Debaryomyces fabryi]|uniref:Altered inheritance of mitochondria protein 24, mitochondrial n=1 Tax=Debaryomyces fabryi TaxID=58627 RepID=A0A0V1PST1_9ASCO|nr:Altered inheritance of mitochondria protein 24, mitochondrial [Debaryomyces fabryi]KRZ99202.1 Altered inheritance of mitochondria protein 24, mitochondrial [Debaryomyces fabryi]CUM45012.1 unnamed protein product [Debaryomyces fabryi]